MFLPVLYLTYVLPLHIEWENKKTKIPTVYANNNFEKIELLTYKNSGRRVTTQQL